MKHLFVPYDIALMAKEKGFNEQTLAYWNDGEFYLNGSSPNKRDSDLKRLNETGFSIKKYDPSIPYKELFFTAPLYQQLLDWLREKHDIYLWIEKNQTNYCGKIKSDITIFFDESFNESYYHAFDAILIHAFKLIK